MVKIGGPQWGHLDGPGVLVRFNDTVFPKQ